jgi:23S rRNA (uracil1939-C5)-methyltransferase
VRLKIEKLVYGGDGLARLPADEHGPGKSVFVPFVLEGEEVQANLTEQKSGFARARLEHVIAASNDRVEPGCPYFQQCGGCHYQYIRYSRQLAAKAAIFRETLRRTAKLDLPCELQIHGSPEWNYRNRTRLKIQTSPQFALGYYKFRSHELLAVQQCPISSPLINRAIGALIARGQEGAISNAARELELFADHDDSSLLLEIYCAQGTSRAEARKIAEELHSVIAEVKGVSVLEEAGQFAEPKKLVTIGEPQIRYQACGISYRVSAGSFFQTNRFLIDELVKSVAAGVSGKLAMDLYAGVGLFSLAVAPSFAQIISVEASQTSYADLQHNAPQEVKAVRATIEQFLMHTSGQTPDVVIADPPRGGLGENVVRNLARVGAPRITYVSCEPSTLARDLLSLVSLGYKIVGAHLFDLFPQTYHIESVLHLTL